MLDKLSACGGFSSTRNIKQLGFNGLRGSSSRASVFLGG